MGGECAVLEKRGGELFAEEDDFGLDEAVAGGGEAVRDSFGGDGGVHEVFWVGGFAVDAALSARFLAPMFGVS